MLRIYQVDAFHHEVLRGNPAAVIPLDHWLPDERLLAIAAENNLSETAFFLPADPATGAMPLRWFTPRGEVRLCGHATLATAHVLFTEIGVRTPRIQFATLSGRLEVERLASPGTYQMDFPADQPAAVPEPDLLRQALGVSPEEVYAGKDDLLVIVDTAATVRQLEPRFELLAKIEKRGVIVSAPGVAEDFVSRCFYPNYGIPEDPVTGSAHTLLTPYWSERLEKPALRARQLSQREGLLACRLQGDRVLLKGQAVTYLRGMIFI
jgi:PhzF family phenazine biosynthesis protein